MSENDKIKCTHAWIYSVQVSGEASLTVLEYGHLTMEEVLSPARLTLTVDLDTQAKVSAQSLHFH